MPDRFLWLAEKAAAQAGFGGFAPDVCLIIEHGDVVVLGGESRSRYHGVMPLKHGHGPLLGNQRLSFTFRKAS